MTNLYQQCVCCGFVGVVEPQRILQLDGSRTRPDKKTDRVLWICDLCYIDMIV